MAKTDAPPPEAEETDVADEAKAKGTRGSVFVDGRILATNQIVRILNDLEPPERRAVMQIVNILLVDTALLPPKEGE